MKKLFFILTALVLFVSIGAVDAQKRYAVLFYNVENLYDTIQDPTIYDTEFIPSGIKEWNSNKYWKKMANLERVFYSVAKQNKSYPTIIGVSEIENRNVLEDIASLEKLQPAGYQICHYDGPDRRGVDCAFFYRPDQFRYEGSESVTAKIPGAPDYFLTRDILTMWGTIEDDPFFFVVSHWPSRRGGESQSSYLREGVATQIRAIADSVRSVNPAVKVVVMGDFNDDPEDRSVSEALGGRQYIDRLEPSDMFNPYLQLHKDGFGTLAYNDAWNLFDNIVVSANLATGSTGKLKLTKSSAKNKYWGNIFSADFLLQKSGQYKGYPLRTYVGNSFQNGFSDHFPVFILISEQ